MTRPLHLAAVAIAAGLLAMAAACGGPTAAASPSAGAAGSPASRADAARAYLDYATCLRAHGADEPDPVLDRDGNPQWAVNPKSLPPQATGACASILQAAHVNGARGAPTAAQLAALTRFAQCVRQHGLAHFPDASPDGSFPTRQDPTLEPGWDAAYQACRQVLPPGKV